MARKKSKSEIDYINRVKKYIDITKIKSRTDLSIEMSKAGLLGKYKQTRQLNIIADEIDFEKVAPKIHISKKLIRISKVTTKQTITRYKKPVTVYRDDKGRFKKHVK